MYPAVASILALLAISFAFAKSIGPHRAIWYLWWPVLLLPTYTSFLLGPIEITLPTVVGSILLACIVMKGSPQRRRWILSDSLMLGLILSGIISEITTGSGIGSSLEVVRRWGIPYLLGRVALGSLRSEKAIPNSFIAATGLVCLGAAMLAVFESLTHVNPYWTFSGHNWDYMTRYGLRRASGPAAHTIGFGMMFVCLFPWAIEAARRSPLEGGRGWWKWLPLLVGAGLFCTVSRGAWVSAAVAIGVLIYLQRPRLRSSMGFSMVVGAAVIWLWGADLVEGVNALAGRDDTSEKSTISIDGESYTYTGTNHRFLQFLAYRVPMEQTGVFGHGSLGMLRLTRGLQKKEYVPGLPSNLPAVFESIDSHYLLTILYSGWAGIGLWLAVSICSLSYLARLPQDEDQFLRHAVAGAVLGIMVGLLTVYSHEPFEDAFIFMLGLAGAWKARSLEQESLPAVLAEPTPWERAFPPSSPAQDRTIVACAIDTK